MKIRVLTLALFAASNANASGIFLPEGTYSNLGTAGAGDGVHTESAAAMFTNPATMSGMGESLFTANLTAFDLEMKYKDTDQSGFLNQGDAKAHEIMPTLALYYVKQLNDTTHAGIALASQGGMAANYGNDWDAALALNDVSLMTMQLNPSISVQVAPKWSVGAGVQMSYMSYEMSSNLLSFEQESDTAFGYNLGVMYQHDDDLKMGLSYRSALAHKIDTKAVGNIGDGNFNQNASLGVEVPAIADFSLAYSLNSKWDLLGTVQWHNWSAWDETPVDIAGNDMNIERDWDDVWHFALGTEYKLNSDWRLKAGFSYETSPQDDPTMQNADLPVGEQWRYSVGAATKVNDLLIDFYYEYADLGSVDVENDFYAGKFDGRLHFLGMSVTY